MTSFQRLAAVDLGSNSFRLELGHQTPSGFVRDTYIKETIRLGGALDARGQLSEQSMHAGWACLERFGQSLKDYLPDEVRAVATQTLREAGNSQTFLARGQDCLGFPIEVISGQEEAQLIYGGVAAALAKPLERRLVIDIGGRSTEIIIGQGDKPLWLRSLALGSVACSQLYFAEGNFTAQAFKQAESAAKALFDAQLASSVRPDWDVAYGAAGTVNAVAEVLTASQWDAKRITRQAVNWLYDELLAAGSADKLTLPGLRADRKPVIGGGLSLLRAFMDALGIDVLIHTNAGLRHGLLQSMLKSRA